VEKLEENQGSERKLQPEKRFYGEYFRISEWIAVLVYEL
jgi:hypothetical protein